MKYFLYWWEHSEILDSELYKITNKVNPKITFIPSSSLSEKDKMFREVIESTFEKYWFIVDYCPIDNWVIWKIDSKSDVIYLSWWKEVEFLKNLVENNINEILINSNCIISWLCAWWMILTESIDIASIFEEWLEWWDLDNDSLDWLNHLPFLFFPFYEDKYSDKLKEFSAKKIWKLVFWISKEWWLSIDWNIISVVWSNAYIYKDWEIISCLSSWEKFYL